MSRPRVSETPQHKVAEERRSNHTETPAPQADLTSSQRTVLAAQQSVGNQAVIRRMMAQNAVQRAVQIDELSTNVSDVNPPTGTSEAGGGSISGAGGSVNVDGSGVSIDSNGPISLNAPIVNASGPVHTPILMADQVIASSYTPGAGNVW